MNKKVLIVTYYWPPAGGPGVQRVLKFAKYLPEFGWDPVILTVQNGEYPAIDESLAKDIPEGCKVYKTKALEPNIFYRKFTGMKSDEKIPVANLAQKNVSWKKKLSNWIRLNLFIPDAKIGWIPYAVKQGKKIIKEEKPDVIFSSSPPPSVHLIAKKLARWSGIKWVADFRDPWTDIYHYDGVKRSAYALNKDLRLEKSVINQATKTVVVSKHIGTYLLKNNFPEKEVEVITNGYDESDFNQNPATNAYKHFTITYAGKINNQQNPENLWKAISELKKESPTFAGDFKLLLMGNITEDVFNSLKSYNLENNLEDLGYVSHPEMIENISRSDLLLLLIPNTAKNLSIVPGKIFEYLATKKYVIGIGPKNGDSAEILKDAEAGEMFEFADIENLKSRILEQYKNWQNKKLHQINESALNKYTRKELTNKLTQLFNRI
jgi:glycosyltransferase involved in cell wall biosynthesis